MTEEDISFRSNVRDSTRGKPIIRGIHDSIDVRPK